MRNQRREPDVLAGRVIRDRPYTTNGEGFGVGWYGASSETPAVFRSIEPAWNDRNLREVASHIESPLFLAHIRASTGTAVLQTDLPPVSVRAAASGPPFRVPTGTGLSPRR